MKLLTIIALTLLVFIGGAILKAETISQSTSSSIGKLMGLILDPGVARVPEAKIRIENKVFKREVKSADDGSYEVDLPNGKYNVTVQRDGFYPSKKTVRITANATTKLNVTIRGIRNDGSHP